MAKHAFYVHCSAHHLNLVIVDAIKSVPDAGNLFSLLERLCVFLSGSIRNGLKCSGTCMMVYQGSSSNLVIHAGLANM